MSSKIKPICIMLARNLVSQGYPFVESILSVASYCKEIIVCEGYSEDNTYVVLKKLSKLYNDKLTVIRKKWKGKNNLGELFAKILNDIIDEYSGEYILKIDPDHVFDKETLEDLIFLASVYPKIKVFRLPYLYFIGNWVIKPILWAPTFFKKEDYIKIGGDSGGIAFTFFGFIKLILSSIKNPFSELAYHAYVPKPVYHYYALFPRNYIARIEEHKKFYKKYDWTPYDSVLEKLKTIKDWNIFWEITAKELIEKTWNWYGGRKVVRYSGNHHPLIKPLIGKWVYSVREELLNE